MSDKVGLLIGDDDQGVIVILPIMRQQMSLSQYLLHAKVLPVKAGGWMGFPKKEG